MKQHIPPEITVLHDYRAIARTWIKRFLMNPMVYRLLGIELTTKLFFIFDLEAL